MDAWLAGLKQALQKRSSIPDDVIWQAKDAFFLRQLAPGDFLLGPGETPTEIAVVASGLMRAFFTGARGKEVTKMFAKDGEFVGAYAAMLSGEPSKLTIQAVKDSSLVCMKFLDLQKLYGTHPSWQELGRKVAEEVLIAREKREYEFLLLPAAERYERFLRDYPDLVELIPQWQIASYLGITPVALSRLRRQRVLPSPKTSV